jgi:hypothetical protein
MEPQLTKFFSETQRRFHNQGKAETLLEILRERGLAVTIKQQHRIVSCTDAAVLQRWVSLALTVASTSELLAPRPPARPANGHATKAKRPATRKAR